MIKSRWNIDTKPIDDLAEFAGDFTNMVYEIGEDILQRYDDLLLDELKYYPPPRPNQEYVRTFRLRDGWSIGISRGTDGFVINIVNDTPYSKYVVGSLAKAISAARGFQAEIHRGRWPLAAETIEFWFEAYMEEFNERFSHELAQFGSVKSRRRAFTR